MNCFNQGSCNSCSSSNCGWQTGNCGWQSGSCGCSQSCGFGNRCGCGGCPRPNPIVMPTQVCVNRRVTPQEQPVIVPVERRTINQCCYYPRFYPVFQNSFYTQY